MQGRPYNSAVSVALSRWAFALADRRAFLYFPDEHYQDLLAKANELYQLGIVCLDKRQEMVTQALGAYSWAIEHQITRETNWCLGCEYELLVGNEVVGTIGSEGHHHDLAGKLIGCIQFGFQSALHRNRPREASVEVGRVVGLSIVCDGQELYQLREVMPRGYERRIWD
ncbi:hypothetical protein [Pseudomonas nitroreducens]|uniref:Uncharacterized protein n=1 Tax=Pseudomonas nitroreducens TaxID=46680 RepID=A0A2D0ADW9_PSENT|nr:hypothetical protein [Pseudomonas nitroreducens]OWP50282.1 hypothetical protein CEG18_12070 [Pseudomonas nitroreducens]